jgi:hypothetical protein
LFPTDEGKAAKAGKEIVTGCFESRPHFLLRMVTTPIPAAATLTIATNSMIIARLISIMFTDTGPMAIDVLVAVREGP